jgi:molybdate transport system ATP-binding protein
MISFEFEHSYQQEKNQFRLEIAGEIKLGQITAIFGQSGAGKSTLLRLMSGLTKAKKGYLKVDREVWQDSAGKIFLPVQKREIGFVFQDYALFPNMTALENIKFGAKRGVDIDELVELLQIDELLNKKPGQLSGGQQQRIALARSVAHLPKILLLDEPFAALDHETQQRMQMFLLKVHERFNLTTIIISHDVGEIYRLADRAIEISKGRVIREGSPEMLFSSSYVSGKLQMVGEVLDIQKADIVYVVTVLIHQQVMKVVAVQEDLRDIEVGSKVMVASKAFNPIIQKII